ncbi:MAG: hypothetical protein GY757_07280 [bacterium]|nr:hypothetical protein [bacterium]
MARVYTNPLIDSFSGKMGNLVFYRRGNAVYCRKWVKPRDPKSPAQLARRGSFALCVFSWQQLDNKTRKTWRKYGRSKNIPGYNAFISVNMNRIAAGKPLLLVRSYRKDTPSLPGSNKNMSELQGFTYRAAAAIKKGVHWTSLLARAP